MKKYDIQDEGMMRDMIAELRISMLIVSSHPNIAKVEQIIEARNSIFVLTGLVKPKPDETKVSSLQDFVFEKVRDF